MMSTRKRGGRDETAFQHDNDDYETTSYMQRPIPSPSPPSDDKETTNGETNPEEPSQTEWMTVAHNFPEGFHVQGLLHLLDKIFGELLEHSFHLNSQYLTHMAYHAAFYINKLIELQDEDQPPERRPGSQQHDVTETQNSLQEHMTVSFHVANPLTEIEATLGNLNVNYEHLPRRHVQNELGRIQTMLEESRLFHKKWAKDPTAPGALPGLAASGNAIDAITFAALATEEGGISTMGEAISVAHQATSRCAGYMEEPGPVAPSEVRDGPGESFPNEETGACQW